MAVTLEESYRYCRGVARSRAKNFYYSFLLLDKPQRDAMCAIYAFMRYCDDLSDEPCEAGESPGCAKRSRTGGIELDRALQRPVRRASVVAGVSRYRRALPDPASLLSRDDRRHLVRSGAAAAANLRRAVSLLLSGRFRRGADHHSHLWIRFGQARCCWRRSAASRFN